MERYRKEIIEKQLLPEETVWEYSQRKPSLWAGCSCLAVGLAVGGEGMMYLFSPFGAAALAGSAVLIYLGVRFLVFMGREGVWVTDRRILYQKVTWQGTPGTVVQIPLKNIRGVRLYKSGAMYAERYSGAVILKLEDKSRYGLPFLKNGQYIMEAIFLGMKKERYANE